MSETLFLVKVTPGQFLVDYKSPDATVIDTPSNARGYSYKEADAVTRQLRKRGFTQAVVTDINGLVMTYERLRAIQISDAAAANKPSLVLTYEEFDKLSSVEVKRRSRDPEFCEAAVKLHQTPRTPKKPRLV
jgi:hypothetical protein